MITLDRTYENEVAARELCEERLDDAGYGFGSDTLSATADTLADFAAQWGEAKQDRDLEDLPHGVWHNVQPTKGAARGTLVVIDFGGFRMANFC